MLGPLSILLSLCKHTYIKHDLLLQFLTFIQLGFGGRQHQSHEKQSGAATKCSSPSDPLSEEEKREREKETESWLRYKEHGLITDL